MRVIFLAMLVFICGCSVVVQNGDDVRYYGLQKKDGLDTLEKIEDKQQEQQEGLRIFK